MVRGGIRVVGSPVRGDADRFGEDDGDEDGDEDEYEDEDGGG